MISAIDLVKRFEGCRLHPYYDVAGVPTVGYGTIYGSSGERIRITDAPITQAEADTLLNRDVAHSAASVARLCSGAKLSEGQAAALTDFTYNLGAGTFQHSTARQFILSGDLALVPEQMLRYVRAGGRVVPGLVKRREAEVEVWNERAV